MDQEQVREAVASFIGIELSARNDVSSRLEIVKVYKPEADVGPFGGKQYKVLCALDDGRDIYPVLIVVYCDGNIEALLRNKLEEDRKRQELRKELLG